MILDLHVHSIYSVDSPVRPEEYARRMVELRDQYELDGFVLMEHNYLVTGKDCDLQAIGRDHGLVILAGAEVDTYWGHLLVYGLTPGLWSWIEGNGTRKQEPLALAREAQAEGALVVPAHPFREGFIGVGLRCQELPGVRAVEGLNGADSERENAAARDLARRKNWAMTGGSDAHFLGELGKALTRFQVRVATMKELVEELSAGRCEALTLEQARRK